MAVVLDHIVLYKWCLYCWFFSFNLCQMMLFLIPFLCQPSIRYKDNMLYYSLLNLYPV